MSKHKAVGIHVFAGAFTVGVQEHFDVVCQLEKHNFGGATCEAMCGIPFVNDENADWPSVDAEFAYGNPRCTGFSCITAGYDEDCHGPWAKQTEDIHELCRYAVDKYDCIIWESVQQAYSVGRPLLDYLRDEIFVPRNYRIAHVLLNAASFGNAQQRKRYFFVAYRNDRNFNIEPPALTFYKPSVYDAIWHLRDRETNEAHIGIKGATYDFDSYARLTNDEKSCIEHLPNGWDLNMLAKYSYDSLPKPYQVTWDTRSSGMPFSMHCLRRLNWTCAAPTLHSSAPRFIHPRLHRPLTIGEIATIMGWPTIPVGNAPVAQIAKGVVPSVGAWLARQAELYLDNAWGSDDWESSYNPVTCEWNGGDSTGQVEKVFNLTKYVSNTYDEERFPDEALYRHRFNVDGHTGRLIKPWQEVRESVRIHGGVDWLGRPADVSKFELAGE